MTVISIYIQLVEIYQHTKKNGNKYFRSQKYSAQPKIPLPHCKDTKNKGNYYSKQKE